MTSGDGSGSNYSARWERRERRRKAARERLQKHGASLRRVYVDAVRKRIAARKKPS